MAATPDTPMFWNKTVHVIPNGMEPADEKMFHWQNCVISNNLHERIQDWEGLLGLIIWLEDIKGAIVVIQFLVPWSSEMFEYI